MSIEQIEKKIMEAAGDEVAGIRKEAEADGQRLLALHNREKEEIKARILREAGQKAEEAKRSHLIPAKIAARKAVLEEKQKILEGLYAQVQKESDLSPAEIGRVREETEVQAAKILFGE